MLKIKKHDIYKIFYILTNIITLLHLPALWSWSWTINTIGYGPRGLVFELSLAPRFVLCGLPNPTPTCTKSDGFGSFYRTHLAPAPDRIPAEILAGRAWSGVPSWAGWPLSRF